MMNKKFIKRLNNVFKCRIIQVVRDIQESKLLITGSHRRSFIDSFVGLYFMAGTDVLDLLATRLP
jgi:hypothetical protein